MGSNKHFFLINISNNDTWKISDLIGNSTIGRTVNSGGITGQNLLGLDQTINLAGRLFLYDDV